MADKKEVSSFNFKPSHKLTKINELLSYVFIDLLKLDLLYFKILNTSSHFLINHIGWSYSDEGSLRRQEGGQGGKQSKEKAEISAGQGR